VAAAGGRASPTRREQYPYRVVFATRWRDNDPYGHVNNAVYYEYIDSVVNRFLIERGVLEIGRSPVVGIVAESWCRFFDSLAYPEPIESGLRVVEIGARSVRYDVGLFRTGAESSAANGGFVHVFVDRDSGRPVSIPESTRRALQSIATFAGDTDHP
jgi:acyl-CoA thioester hydrolase